VFWLYLVVNAIIAVKRSVVDRCQWGRSFLALWVTKA
jgi:hypothetical protein